MKRAESTRKIRMQVHEPKAVFLTEHDSYKTCLLQRHDVCAQSSTAPELIED